MAFFFRGELLGSVFSFGLTWLVTSSGAQKGCIFQQESSDFLDSSRWGRFWKIYRRYGQKLEKKSPQIWMHFSSIWFWRYHHEDDKAFFLVLVVPHISSNYFVECFLQIIIILCLMVWYGTIWCGMISYGMRRYDAIWWCGMALDIWDDKTMLNKLNMSIYTLSYQYTHHLSTRCHICTIC